MKTLASSLALAFALAVTAAACGSESTNAPVPRDPGARYGTLCFLDGGWVGKDGGPAAATVGSCETNACALGGVCQLDDAGVPACDLDAVKAGDFDAGASLFCVSTNCGVIRCEGACACTDSVASTCDCGDAGVSSDAGSDGGLDGGDGGASDAGDAGSDAGADAGSDAGADAGQVDAGPLCALGDAGACMDLACDAGCTCFKPDGGAPLCSCPAVFPDAGAVCRSPNCGSVECGFGCACADVDASVCYCGDARNTPDGGFPLTVRSTRTGTGNGSIDVDPPDASVLTRTEQTFFLDAGTLVFLAAVPSTAQGGSTFIAWDGGCKANGNDAGCLLRMDGPHDVTGTFNK